MAMQRGSPLGIATRGGRKLIAIASRARARTRGTEWRFGRHPFKIGRHALAWQGLWQSVGYSRTGDETGLA